jgi:hypothetical protein
MALLGTGFRRVLLLIVIAICIILVALNIVLNAKLRSYIPGLIEQFSSESPYKIEVGKMSLDPLFRVQFDRVRVLDPSAELKEVLKVNSITVKPDVLTSILSRKINMGEIVLNTPVAQSNKENINNLTDFLENLNGDKKKESKVEFGTIKILSADFQITPEFLLSVPNLKIKFADSESGKGRQIDFNGRINLLEKELISAGTIIISSDKTTGNIEIRIDKIDASGFTSLSGGSKELKATAKTDIVISDLISLNGGLTIDSRSGIFSEEPFADATYGIDYDKANDKAAVSKLDIRVNDLVSGTFSGEIDNLIKETVFNLSGELSPIDLKDLMVKVFGGDKGILSGELKTKNLKLSGSREKNNIMLSGEALLNDFKYHPEVQGDPEITDLSCGLKISQDLNAADSFGLTSSGNCTAGEFMWDKTGEVSQINARVNIDSKNNWQDNKVTLSDISSRFMEGSAGGSLNFFLAQGFGGGITKITGNIDGSDLNLAKTPKTIIPADITGNAASASANFEGGSSNYKADILMTVDNFILKSNKGRDFRVSQLQTVNPVKLEYKSLSGEEGNSGKSAEDEIIVKGGSVSYRNLSFEEYAINNGSIKDLDFFLELGKDIWSLDMSSEGSDFAIVGYDVTLEKFSESLQIKNSGREGFRGSVQGTNGKYRSVEFPELSWSYNFINDRIIVSNVKAQISTLGQFKTDNLYVNVGAGTGGYPYRVNFDEAVFSGFEEKLESEGIKGEFVVNKPGTADHDWQGSVEIKKTSIVSAVVENISNTILPAPGGIILENIKGEFLNGDISGDISIDTTTTPSGIVADLKLINALTEAGSTTIKLSEASLSFSGALPNGSLPEGKGKLELKNIMLENEGATSKLNSTLNTRTIAETLYIDEGFITDSANKKISFSGKMDNSLNENRTLNLSFPDVAVSDAFGILSPLVPRDFREFKSSGYAGLDVVFHNLLYPRGRWGGKLSLKNSSLSGDYGGAQLSIKDINGTITIKDKVSSDNPLTDFMGDELKLSKSIFQKFLTTFNETNLDRENLDFLDIREIEYGILKFENIECALEVDSQKINLRRIISKLFRGDVDGAGLIQFNQEKSKYDLSLLFNEISLEAISEKVSPNQEYITGRINGVLWLTGNGAELDTINGPFQFWSKKSGKEQRKIGKALLDKLGAKERLILGSNRSYDNGNISGYINNGLITFKEFDVTNSILGIKNLSIQADSVRNSITISHLISVIRELSRRSETGGPMIETN